jgi:intron-binding protein aquarius
MDAKADATGRTFFAGWARMCASIDQFTVTEVRKPNIGETKPAEVKAEIQLDLSQFNDHIRREWDELREHDIVFIVTIRATQVDSHATGIAGYEAKKRAAAATSGGRGRGGGKGGGRGRGGGRGGGGGGWREEDCTFPQRYGVVHVRGCEVAELKDEEGVTLNDTSGRPDKRESGPVGNHRTLKVLLDSAQYQKDMADPANRCG